MTVKELIVALSLYRGDLKVIVSKDGEGNDFSPLYDMTNEYYIARSNWSGEVVPPDADISEDATESLILWPVN